MGALHLCCDDGEDVIRWRASLGGFLVLLLGVLGGMAE